MESGKLNERITIKSHDGQTSYDVWCNVRPVTTREQLRNSTVLANNLLTLQIRYLKNINNTYRVVYQGYEYDIVKRLLNHGLSALSEVMYQYSAILFQIMKAVNLLYVLICKM